MLRYTRALDGQRCETLSVQQFSTKFDIFLRYSEPNNRVRTLTFIKNEKCLKNELNLTL